MKNLPVSDLCTCGCWLERHVASGCVGRQIERGPFLSARERPCECRDFRPLRAPEPDPFLTIEHYLADRRGTWTGD